MHGYVHHVPSEDEGKGSMDELPVVPSEGDSASGTEDESPLSKR